MKNDTTPRPTGTHRWIRQFHLWIGAWGALAAILYGLTGLVMNHRFGPEAWPQGDSSEAGRTTLNMPADARSSPERLSLWLQETERLDPQVIRKGKPGDVPVKWNFSGGNASESWSLEVLGSEPTAHLKRSSHTSLAAMNRLHKAVGGGPWWTLLADSFAIAMVLLGLSGLWMWARGRTPRQMVFSVMGLSTLAFLAVIGMTLL